MSVRSFVLALEAETVAFLGALLVFGRVVNLEVTFGILVSVVVAVVAYLSGPIEPATETSGQTTWGAN